jgi:hypothetical protein
MKHGTLHLTASIALAAPLLIALAGCTEQVVGGVETNPGSGSGASGPGATESTSAVAVLGSGLPENNPDNYLTVIQYPIQPDMLYVFIGNFDEPCSNPFPPACNEFPDDETLDQWQIIVGIPAALQQQGVLSLPMATVMSAVGLGAAGPPGGASTCSIMPDGLVGNIAITSIDASQITLNFMGVKPQGYAPYGPPPVVTAEYTASRCP